jgi:hypothetical protein
MFVFVNAVILFGFNETLIRVVFLVGHQTKIFPLQFVWILAYNNQNNAKGDRFVIPSYSLQPTDYKSIWPIGDKETSVTFALGYTISRSPALLKRILEHAGINGIPNKYLTDNTKINIKSSEDRSRTDILITIGDKALLVIEGKLKRTPNRSDIDQCKRYVLKILRPNSGPLLRNRKLLYIHEESRAVKDVPWAQYVRSKVETKYWKHICDDVTWNQVEEDCEVLSGNGGIENNERLWLEHFWRFIDVERFTWVPLDRLVDEKQLHKIIDLIECFNRLNKREGWKLELVPGKGPKGEILIFRFGRNEGWLGYRKSSKDIFGIGLKYGHQSSLQLWLKLRRKPTKAQAEFFSAGRWDQGPENEWYSPTQIDYQGQDLIDLFGILRKKPLKLFHSAYDQCKLKA